MSETETATQPVKPARPAKPVSPERAFQILSAALSMVRSVWNVRRSADADGNLRLTFVGLKVTQNAAGEIVMAAAPQSPPVGEPVPAG